jgi:hypothetical protein
MPCATAASSGPSTVGPNRTSTTDIWDDTEVSTKEDDSDVFKPDGRARPK